MLKIKIVVEITAAMGSIKHDNNNHGQQLFLSAV